MYHDPLSSSPPPQHQPPSLPPHLLSCFLSLGLSLCPVFFAVLCISAPRLSVCVSVSVQVYHLQTFMLHKCRPLTNPVSTVSTMSYICVCTYSICPTCYVYYVCLFLSLFFLSAAFILSNSSLSCSPSLLANFQEGWHFTLCSYLRFLPVKRSLFLPLC